MPNAPKPAGVETPPASTEEKPFIWFVSARTWNHYHHQLPRLRASLRGVFRYVSSPNVLRGYNLDHVGFVEIDDASTDSAINVAWCEAVNRVEKSNHPLVYIELNTEPRS